MKLNLVETININVDSIEVILRITRICNQKCIFCFVENDKYNFTLNEIIEEVTKITKKYKGKNIEYVITGGEPTTNPYFFEIIEYLYNNGQFIRLQTNAVFFGKEENIKKMKPYLDKTNLFISFHSHIEKLYDFITQSKGLYKSAIKGIQNLFGCNYLELNIVLNKLNIDYFVHYIEFLGKTFGDKGDYLLNISTLSNMTMDNNVGKISVPYSKIVKEISRAELFIKKYNINIAKAFGGPSDLPFCIGNKLFYFEDSFYTNSQNRSDRSKFDFCSTCNYNDYCNGILNFYIDKYGKDEFKPIIKK